MLEWLTALYSKNNRNQQYYEYSIIFTIVFTIIVINNISAVINANRLPIMDFSLGISLASFFIFPISMTLKIRGINKSAHPFTSEKLHNATKIAPIGHIENSIYSKLETIQKLSLQDRITTLNRQIDKTANKNIATSLIYAIPFFASSMIYLLLTIHYHDSIFEIIQREASGQWDRRSRLVDIHYSKTNLVSNLIFATIALQAASGLAITAAYSDLRNAVEGSLMSGSMKSGAEAISPSTAP